MTSGTGTASRADTRHSLRVRNGVPTAALSYFDTTVLGYPLAALSALVLVPLALISRHASPIERALTKTPVAPGEVPEATQ